MLTKNQIDQLARASFETYKKQRLREGLPVEYEQYEEQPATLIWSGRAQVLDIETKISMLGYKIKDSALVQPTDHITDLTPNEIESLAIYEHDRWMKNRIADGWTFGKTKDTDRKITPYLVVWEELSEQMKDFDREPVRNIIPLLESVGLAVSQ